MRRPTRRLVTALHLVPSPALAVQAESERFADECWGQRAHQVLAALLPAAGRANARAGTFTTEDIADWVTNPDGHVPQIRALLSTAGGHWLGYADSFIDWTEQSRNQIADVILRGPGPNRSAYASRPGPARHSDAEVGAVVTTSNPHFPDRRRAQRTEAPGGRPGLRMVPWAA